MAEKNDIIGRELSCEEEHRLSCDNTLRCEGKITHAKWVRAYPKEEQINLP
jgi:hypothetical protein